MRRLIFAVLPLAFLAACQPASAPLSDDDVAAIRNLATSYAQAYVAKDVDGVVAVYADDAFEMPPDVPANVGKTAIRNSYQRAFAVMADVGEMTLTPVEIDGIGELAYDRGTWSWTGVLPGTTEATTMTGKYVAILRRQEDGTWLWTEVIWNGDEPMPQAE
jgi:uncharacterized protein (TIGR02246 family)